MKRRAAAAGNAVVRPQHLLQTVQIDDVERLFTGMGGGKALVPGGMPVLRGYHQQVAADNPVYRLDNGIALSHRQAAARHEVVLNIDQKKGSHGFLLS
jgi:hypothetical protein